MFGWSRPLRTAISAHTLASLPLTLRFGMTLSAISSAVASASVGEAAVAVVAAASDASSAAAAPCCATPSCSGGTCHVASCPRQPAPQDRGRGGKGGTLTLPKVPSPSWALIS
jgi:hypothetical protein